MFHHLDREDVRAMANAFKSASFSSGDALVRQGEPGKAFFLVDSGECQLLANRAAAEALARGDPPPVRLAAASLGHVPPLACTGGASGTHAAASTVSRAASVQASHADLWCPRHRPTLATGTWCFARSPVTRSASLRSCTGRRARRQCALRPTWPRGRLTAPHTRCAHSAPHWLPLPSIARRCSPWRAVVGAMRGQTIAVGSAFRRQQRQLDLVSRVSLLSELTRAEQEVVSDGLQPELFEVSGVAPAHCLRLRAPTPLSPSCAVFCPCRAAPSSSARARRATRCTWCRRARWRWPSASRRRTPPSTCCHWARGTTSARCECVCVGVCVFVYVRVSM